MRGLKLSGIFLLLGPNHVCILSCDVVLCSAVGKWVAALPTHMTPEHEPGGASCTEGELPWPQVLAAASIVAQSARCEHPAPDDLFAACAALSSLWVDACDGRDAPPVWPAIMHAATSNAILELFKHASFESVDVPDSMFLDAVRLCHTPVHSLQAQGLRVMGRVFLRERSAARFARHQHNGIVACAMRLLDEGVAARHRAAAMAACANLLGAGSDGECYLNLRALTGATPHFVERVVGLVTAPSPRLRMVAARAVRNIVGTHVDNVCDRVVAAGVLQQLTRAMESGLGKSVERREIVWCAASVLRTDAAESPAYATPAEACLVAACSALADADAQWADAARGLLQPIAQRTDRAAVVASSDAALRGLFDFAADARNRSIRDCCFAAVAAVAALPDVAERLLSAGILEVSARVTKATSSHHVLRWLRLVEPVVALATVEQVRGSGLHTALAERLLAASLCHDAALRVYVVRVAHAFRSTRTTADVAALVPAFLDVSSVLEA